MLRIQLAKLENNWLKDLKQSCENSLFNSANKTEPVFHVCSKIALQYYSKNILYEEELKEVNQDCSKAEIQCASSEIHKLKYVYTI